MLSCLIFYTRFFLHCMHAYICLDFHSVLVYVQASLYGIMVPFGLLVEWVSVSTGYRQS